VNTPAFTLIDAIALKPLPVADGAHEYANVQATLYPRVKGDADPGVPCRSSAARALMCRPGRHKRN
jgi:hypothetical protein